MLQKPLTLRAYKIQLTRGVNNNRRPRLWIHFTDLRNEASLYE
jgi:hypothetical protein